ncbi:MAG: class I SAM-dependent methyltransferase [Acidobacteriota bacterium]|nr:class I SAM-dependent methyltransferase [Acidobacteriota bacterium]
MTPSNFIARWLPEVRNEFGPRCDLLDLAMGTGRHARFAMTHRCRVYGVDRDLARVRQAKTGGLERGQFWIADLETSALPSDRFDVIICTNYLQRSLWNQLRATVRSGGFVLYETFTVAQLAHGTGPRSPDHLLKPDELRHVFAGWQQWAYEELRAPTAVARIVVRKPRTTDQPV